MWVYQYGKGEREGACAFHWNGIMPIQGEDEEIEGNWWERNGGDPSSFSLNGLMSSFEWVKLFRKKSTFYPLSLEYITL